MKLDEITKEIEGLQKSNKELKEEIIFQILKLFNFLKEIIYAFYIYLSHYFFNIHHFLFSKTIYLFLINIFICKYLEF